MYTLQGWSRGIKYNPRDDPRDDLDDPRDDLEDDPDDLEDNP